MSTVYSDDSRNLITLENGDSSKSRNLSHVESLKSREDECYKVVPDIVHLKPWQPTKGNSKLEWLVNRKKCHVNINYE